MKIPTKQMTEAGGQIASDLMDAQVSWSMNGLGRSRSWREFISQDLQNKDLIEEYIAGNILSVDAIYIAMERAK